MISVLGTELNNISFKKKKLYLQICFRQFNNLVHIDEPVTSAYDLKCISI